MHVTCRTVGIFVALALSAAADDKKILGKDDLDFARALSRSGYADLAEKVCSAIEKNRRDVPGEILGAQSIRIDIQFDQAAREQEPKKRKDRLVEILNAKNDFIKTHGEAKEAADLLESLPDLYRLIGESIATILEKEEDPRTQSDLRTQGGTLFEEAESLLRKRAGELRKKVDDARAELEKNPNDKALDDKVKELDVSYMISLSSLARTMFFHGLMLDAANPERTKLLTQTVEKFDDIELDYSDKLACFEGYIYRGLALKALGKPKEGVKSFDRAIKLRELYPKVGNVFDVEPDSADVISNAVLQKMVALKEENDHQAAIAVAHDFLDRTRDAVHAVKGIAILATLADEYGAIGDQKNLEKMANKLLEIDPRGPGGERGRQLLGGGESSRVQSKMGAANTLALAGSTAAKGEAEKATQLCRQVLEMIRGSPQEAELGSETCVLLGAIYAQRGWLEEAAVAWDSALERYPTGSKTPDALYRAVNCYLQLQQTQKRPAYEKLMRQRMDQLGTMFPKHPSAAKIQLIEGQRFENLKQYVEAAAIYEKVQPGSAAYEEAEYRAGSVYAQQARKLAQDGKTAEAKQFAQKAETLLKKSMADLDASLPKTIDPDMQARISGLKFSARVALGNLLLMEGVNRPAEVLPLFESVEKETPDDAVRLRAAWDLRFRAHQAMGKVDDAVAMLQAAVKQNPNAKGIDGVALTAGKTLETRAIELMQKQPDAPQVDEEFKKAQTYYWLGLQAQLEGKEAIRVTEMETVAKRLVLIGLRFNKVPKDVNSFADWTGRISAPEAWQQAAKVYESLLPWTTSYVTSISLAQTYGWLQRWKDAATAFAKIFENESFVDNATLRMNPQALEAKPELFNAYFEWGVAEHRAFLQDHDKTRFERASLIFRTVTQNSPGETKNWWQSQFLLVKLFVDGGAYEKADILLRGVERNGEDWGAKFGYKDAFQKLKEEVGGKVFNAPSSVPAKKGK